MLIASNLPLDHYRFDREDQTLTITGASWSDYEKLFFLEYPGYLASYFKEEIFIVSPGRNHERIAEVINRLIVAYCEKYNIIDYPFGQTRLSLPNQAGREPDIAYAFHLDKDKPDLAVEVIISSGDIEVLKASYQMIGVPELWIWKNNQIMFYLLEKDVYVSIDNSKALTGINKDFFVRYINRGLSESPSAIKKDFLQQI